MALKTASAFEVLTSFTVIGPVKSSHRIRSTAIPNRHQAAINEPTNTTSPAKSATSYGNKGNGSILVPGNHQIRKLAIAPRTANVNGGRRLFVINSRVLMLAVGTFMNFSPVANLFPTRRRVSVTYT